MGGLLFRDCALRAWTSLDLTAAILWSVRLRKQLHSRSLARRRLKFSMFYADTQTLIYVFPKRRRVEMRRCRDPQIGVEALVTL